MIRFKKTIFYISLFVSISCFSQQRVIATFGEPTYLEREMVRYEKDEESPAVVLFERGKNYVKIIDNRIRLVKEVHRKIKVFDPSKFEHGEVEIYYLKSKNTQEKIVKLEAVTHNGDRKIFVLGQAIYDIDINESLGLKRFTFPDIKKGSILEYTYNIESPYFADFGGWDFQGDLPKIYTEFNTEVTANYQYKRALFGNQELFLNEVSIKENCFSIPSSSSVADCEVALYAMKDVPKFKEEPHMLSKKNYLARVTYELSHTIDFNGEKERFTKNWNDVEREFKHELPIGIQLGSKTYFKDNIPANILAIEDPLEKATSIYYFIQNRMTWNGSNGIFSDFNVKKAFEAKAGNTAEINIALINALNAANLKAVVMLLSTRSYGLPTTKYPVLTDYNYLMASLKIGEKEYHLDATDKESPFGILPFKTLNVRGRVLDYKNDSYWSIIEPFAKNVHYINTQLIAQQDGSFKGKASEVYTGYIGVFQRKIIQKRTLDKYINGKGNNKLDVELDNIKIENLEKIDLPLKENYELTLTFDTDPAKVYLYPLFLDYYLSESPFKSNSRANPIDFGFPFTNTYMVSIDLNNQYEVVDLPMGKIYKLPEDKGECSIAFSQKNGKINIRLSVKLKEFRFEPEYYQYLKEFFSNVISMQTKEVIVLNRL
jgi:hypothetical protein